MNKEHCYLYLHRIKKIGPALAALKRLKQKQNEKTNFIT